MPQPLKPSGRFGNTTKIMAAVAAAPQETLGVKVERVILAVAVIAADVAGALFYRIPWYVALAMFVFALILAAPGLVKVAIQTTVSMAKDAKALKAS